MITLSFTTNHPAELVTAGYLQAKGKKDFSGDYVDFLVEEAGGYLQGAVNLIVVPVSPERTKVSVKASYDFTATIPDQGTYVWSFDSGSSDTRLVSSGLSLGRDTVTMVPTYKTEKSILNAIAKMQGI